VYATWAVIADAQTWSAATAIGGGEAVANADAALAKG